MKKVTTSIVAAALLALSVTTAGAENRSGFTGSENRALDLYEQCWHKAGAECGRNVVDDGYRQKNGTVRDPTAAEVNRWGDRLDLIVHPPPAPVAPAPTTSADTGVTTYAPAPATGGGCPSYMAAEASSPDAVNPSSGASGCYQVLPSTAAAMGSACADVNSGACVAAICASSGNGAWSSSGATPCDYVQP